MKKIYTLFLFTLISFLAISQNLIINGDFESGFTGWSNQSGSNGSSASFAISTSVVQQGTQAYSASVSNLGTNAWDIQTFGPSFTATVGHNYIVTFYAKSSVVGAKFRLIMQNTSYLSQDFTLTPTWTLYTWQFSAAETNPQIRFNLSLAGNAGSSIYVDNLQVSEDPLGKCKGKYFGNIIQYSVPTNYSSLWNQATSENGSKWGSVEGTLGTFNFNTSDLAYNWAKNNGGMFKYHNFVWGSQTPSWVASASVATIQAEVANYIKAVANHYSPMGGLQLIDVLNEPVNTAISGNYKAALIAGYQAEPANAGDLNNPYGWAIWPYQLARKYFPNATLLINEYNVEMNWGNCRASYISIVNAIQNAPNLTDGKKNLIDGIGLQCHGIEGLTASNFQTCLDELWAKTGIPIHITEFDQAANPDETLQLSIFSSLIPIAWAHPHVAGITLWGYTQGTTWINGNGTSGPSGTDSGLLYASSYTINPGGERPAMTWLKSYMSSQPNLTNCPLPATVGPGWGSSSQAVNFANTYLNPIQPGDHPDQTLLRVGNDYYSTGSSFHYNAYVPILHSTDLVHWEVISRVVPSNWSGLGNDAPANGIWQGALAYFNNKYWVYYSNSNAQYFSNASNPAGPWSAPTKVTGSTVTGYDNSIFVDDDGTPYMLMKNGQSINRIQQIDKSTGQLTGTLLNMDWVNVNNRFSWAEGPVMCKNNGRYYYFVAGDVSGGQYVLSSATLTANEASWTVHGNFFNTATNPGGFTGPNHISQPVQIQDGTWWVLSHSYDNSGWAGQGRLGLLNQVIWDVNGVPHGVPPSVNPVAAPNLSSNNLSFNFPKSDDFGSVALNPNWHFFNKTTASQYSLTDRAGYMSLKPGNGTTHILQKEGGHYYSLVTQVEVNAASNTSSAGLRIMNGNDDLSVIVYSGYNNGKKIGISFNGISTEVNNTIGNIVWLKMERNLHQITGYYSADGNTWTQIGQGIDISNLDTGQANFNEWVGNSLGLYAIGVTAYFNEFKFRDGASVIPAVGFNNQNLVLPISSTVKGNVVGYIENNDWITYAGIDLGSVSNPTTMVEVEVASGNNGGTIEIWIDNIDSGTKIATLSIPGTSGWEVWKKFSTACSIYGQHDVYLKCSGGAGGLFNLNTIQFLKGSTCLATIISPSSSFCTGSNVTLSANSGNSYKWFSGTTQVGTAQTYTATTAGDYTVQVTNSSGCTATSAIKTITVNPLPTITPYLQINGGAWNGTTTATVCLGDTVSFGPWPTVAPGWSWTGPNSFANASRSPQVTFQNANQGGVYTVTYTDANGCKANANFTVTVSLPVASINASGPTIFCQGGSVTLTSSTGVSYKWFNGTTQVGTASTYTATAAGSYTVEVTNTSGCKATSAVTAITVNALPTATITAPATSFCSGGNVVLSASTGASYKWFNGTTQVGTASTYTASAAGSYTVEVTNTSGCKATSAVTTITVNALPTATITAPATSFCSGGNVVLSASTGASYKWFNGTTQVGTASTYTASAAGSYTVEVTNTSGCKATSAVTTITVNALPTATITAPATSFCSGGNVVLTASTGASYKWFNGTTQVGTASTYTASAAGSYTVEVTNASGCKATSAVTTITVNASPTATITASATSFCSGGNVVLTASTGASYTWFNGTTQVGTASTYTATAAGSYTVEVTNASGCKATSAVTTITVNALPTATITAAATSFCSGGNVVLTASTGASYKWFNGTTQVGTVATYTASAAGSYTIEVTNASGCKATSTVTTITVDALPTATITASATSFCSGGNVVLTASTGASYKWFNGTTQVGTASTYTASAAGSYTVEVTNASGCKATSAVTTITVDALPTATITTSATSFCSGGNVVLTASTGASYKWFNGTTQVGTASTYTASAAGSFTVEVTNASGCKATSAVTTITVDALPTATITASATSFCSGGNVVLTASTGASYKWFNGTTQVGTASTYTASAAGSYTVEVTNASGCKATSASQTITVTTSIIWYQDIDGDGKGDASSTLTSCKQPIGYVSIAGDACPSDPNKFDPGICGCGNTETSCLDCAGTPNGTAFLDNCKICVGGTTGNRACVSTVTINGTTSDIKVMPQPFDLTTTIRLENQGNIQSITIFNASGALVQTVHNLNTQEITFGDELAAGLYTVIVQTEYGIYNTKIIKK